MKKKYVILSLILIMLLSACKSNENAKVNNGKEAKEKNQAAVSINTDSSSVQIKPVNEDDFVVEYKNTKVLIGEAADKVLKELGPGSANEDNNYGFEGWDKDNKFKIFNHGYPAEESVIQIKVKNNVADNTSIISEVEVDNLAIKRGIKAGDTYDKVVQVYGSPQKQSKTEEGDASTYALGKKEISFYFGENKVLQKVIYRVAE